MPQYRVMIQSANYSEWEFIPMDKMQPQVATDLPINPLELKLFSKDIILYDNTEQKLESVVHSEVRTGIHYAGILLLEQNKTYGRTQNKKRLLYKCIPDDRHLPAFLIPYEIKLGFQKQQKNKYIVFQFDQWNQQHPQGNLIETIGDTDQLSNFYEYQLYCKSLHISLTDFTNKTREQLQQKNQEENIQQMIENPDFHIEDRRDIPNIMTIDPEHSTDFDDAFSIETLNETLDKSNQYKISVYIANVYVWLETLHLWKSFSNRISTIYLPDRKRPMLPTILSDSLCSLQEGVTRFAFAADFFIDQTTLDIINIEYHHVAIKVNKNYRYEEHKLLYDNPDYRLLFKLTTHFDKSVTDSHDLVAYWMVKMNATCGQTLANRNIGIFRQATFTKKEFIEPNISNLQPKVQRIVQMWNNISGQYIIYDNKLEILHDGMKLKNYIHITSPIRRLVDLLNHLWLSSSLGLIENLSEDANIFLEKWIRDIDYLNSSTRSIRKIQTDCEVLHRCFIDPTIMEKEHQGILFDKIQKNDQSFVYMVYLTDVKLLSRLKTYTEFDNYSQMPFHIYLFEDEHSFKKKIRVQPIV